jgi:hypothetical protein
MVQGAPPLLQTGSFGSSALGKRHPEMIAEEEEDGDEAPAGRIDLD